MKMNPEVKARWVAALRSGEYKQARRKLRLNGAYCCLGVLCDLFAKESGKTWRTRDLSEQGPLQDYMLTSHRLPDQNLPGASVCVWAGLDPHANVLIGDSRRTLFDHNDDGRTFAEIADAIEKQL